MKKLLTLLFLIPLTSLAQDFSELKEEGVAAQIYGFTTLKMIQPIEAQVIITDKKSKIFFKKSLVKLKIGSNKPPTLYVRGIMALDKLPLCMIKMDEKDMDCTSKYDPETGNEMNFIPIETELIDEALKVHKVTISTKKLEPGFYAIFFRNENNGNMTGDGGTWEIRPFVFEYRFKKIKG